MLMKSEMDTIEGIEKIADLPFYSEGPVVDRYDAIYCTTLRGGSILKIDPVGNRTEWARSACPNGQFILSNGDHVVCDSLLAEVKRFGPDGSFIKHEVREFCAREKIFTPNDVIADSQGNIYFTDSIRYSGKVFFVGYNGREGVVAADLDYPNGLVLSKDEKCLYVAESFGNRILKIDLGKRERIMDPVLFVNLPAHPSGKKEDNLPDGLAIDEAGNIWVAHHGLGAIYCYAADGRHLRSIKTGLVLTSNLSFLDSRTLIVTGGHAEPGPGALLKIHI